MKVQVICQIIGTLTQVIALVYRIVKDRKNKR